jgi:hypothetical protein
MRITEPLPFFHHSTFFLKFSLKILLYIFDYKSHAVWVWELKFNPTNQPTERRTTNDGPNDGRAKRRETANGRPVTCILDLGTIYLL